jgi:hypothetical protein
MFDYVIIVKQHGKTIERITLKGYSGHAAMDEMKWLRSTKYPRDRGYELTLV